jgi:hypothetical protein
MEIVDTSIGAGGGANVFFPYNRILFGGNTGMNTSAQVQIDSTTRGFLPPRTATTASITSPAQGLITYLTGSTNEGLYYYNSGSQVGWHKMLTNTGSQSITGSLNIQGSGSSVTTGNALSIQNGIGTSLLTVRNDGPVQAPYGLYSNGNDGKSVFVGNDSVLSGFSSTALSAYDTSTSQYRTQLILTGNSTTPYVNVRNSMYVGGVSTVPSAQLHVKGSGTTSATTTLRVEDSNGSASLFVRDDGRVGIGTTSPAYALDVNGSFRATTLYSANWSYDGASNTKAIITQGSVAGDKLQIADLNAYTGVSNQNQVIIYNTGFNPSSGTGVYNALALAPTVSQSGATGITRGLYIAPTLTSAANFRAIETTSGSVSFNHGATSLLFVSSSGNVGIGTTTPAYKLEAVASQFGGFRLAASTSTFLMIDTTTTAFTINQSNTETSLVTSNFGPLYFKNNGGGQTRMTLFANGNFAIGTTTDSGRLTVRGSGATSATTALRVENTNASASLVVLDNGYTGIGIATPSSSLHIKGATNSASSSSLLVRNSSNTLLFQVLDNGQVYIPEITYVNNIQGFSTDKVQTARLISGNPVGAMQASAQLEIVSTTQGFLPPRMTNAQRTAITSPAVGLMVYCTDATEGLYINKSTGWTFIA